MQDMINGYESGYSNGISKGMQERSVQIAKQMKIEKIDIKIISKITGLTEEEINKIN